jgi:hypothetical protein
LRAFLRLRERRLLRLLLLLRLSLTCQDRGSSVVWISRGRKSRGGSWSSVAMLRNLKPIFTCEFSVPFLVSFV